jgi:hypothetical protein
MSNKVVFVSSESGDWQGVYVDGVLKREDHVLCISDVLSILDISVEQITVSEEWFGEEVSILPKTLKEIPKDKVL